MRVLVGLLLLAPLALFFTPSASADVTVQVCVLTACRPNQVLVTSSDLSCPNTIWILPPSGDTVVTHHTVADGDCRLNF